MSWEPPHETTAGDRMAGRFRRISSELAEICDLIVEADRHQEFLADGAPHVVQWLTARFSIDPSFGRRLVTVARRLQDLPRLRERFGAGEISFDVVEMLSEVANPENEDALLAEAEGADLADVERLMRRAKPPTADAASNTHRNRWLALQWDLHGTRLSLAGNLPGDQGAIFEEAVVAAAKKTPPNPETGTFDSWDVRMADGLVELCATSTGAGAPAQLTIHADLNALTDSGGVAEVQGGPVIANETARRLACDAVVEVAVRDGDTVLGVGRNTRLVPGWLRRQLVYRDHHCQFPGCDRTQWLQAHHRQHWSEGGLTDLDNLVLLCAYHHWFVHEYGWHITGDPNGKLVFRRPDWTPYPPPVQHRDLVRSS
ncbi:MAG TPA: HNH endonuclease [Acidimicrobiia bacterium]|nr:HNH endonuclease [Acidimicrobiia bacterium]